MKIKTVEKTVIEILKNDEYARKDDHYLYLKVLQRFGFDTTKTVGFFLAFFKFTKMPSFKTVERVRRHIQELMPELKESDMAIIREQERIKFEDYNRTNVEV